MVLPLHGASRPAGGGTALTAATSSQQERGGEGEEKGAAAYSNTGNESATARGMNTATLAQHSAQQSPEGE